MNSPTHKPLLSRFKGLPFADRLVQGGVAALQAVCGASMAYGLAQAIHAEQSFWAAITAIAVTQPNYTDTVNLSRDQFIGAMIGAIFGFFGATLGAGHYIGYVATVMVVIVICWGLNVGQRCAAGRDYCHHRLAGSGGRAGLEHRAVPLARSCAGNRVRNDHQLAVFAGRTTLVQQTVKPSLPARRSVFRPSRSNRT